MSEQEWNELYKTYPRDIVEHLLTKEDLLCQWAAEVIENLRAEIHSVKVKAT